MSIEIRVPPLPESVADATVLSWHKKPGDLVSRDETLVDLETDKVVLEVPAPQAGILKEVHYRDGETVQADALLAILDNSSQPATHPAATPATDRSRSAPLSPAVRVLIQEQGIDPRQIEGTGKHGRILKADVERYLQDRTAAQAPPPAEAPGGASTTSTAIPDAPPDAGRTEERAPMTRLRKRVAERLLEAQHNAAILSTFNEVDLQAVADLRQRYREQFEQRHDIRLGYMFFFVKAAVEALSAFPVVNASVDGDEIVYHSYFDIGIAVSSPRGLVVPILRDADQLSFAEIERQIRLFGNKAKEGSLSYQELTGGTFSISNGGVFGSLLSTPILNPPQSAILGMHAIQQRPVVKAGEIVIRPMMYLALSYDHRIIDGREAVQFLVSIKEHLEDPSRLLLAI